MKYVYIISSSDCTYKLGFSKHPAKRLTEIKTSNPNDLKIIFTFQSKYASIIEAILKNYFKDIKKSGEWFEFENFDIEHIKNQCRVIDSNLTFLSQNTI